MSLRPMPVNANIILRVPGSPDIQLGGERIHFNPNPDFNKEKYKRILIERSLLNPDDDIVVNFGMLHGGNRSVILTRVSDSAGGLANNGSGFNGLPYIAKAPKTYPIPIFDAMMTEIKATYPDYPRAQNFSEDTRPEKIVQKYKSLLNEACPNYETKFKDLVQRNPHYYLGNEISYFRQYETLCQREKDKGYWEEEYAKMKKNYNDLSQRRGGRGRGNGGERSKLQKIREKIDSFPASPNLIQFPTLQNNLSGLFIGPAGAGGGGAGSAVRHRKRKQRKTQKRKNRRNRTRKN